VELRIRRVGAVDEQVGLERERVVDVVRVPLPGVEGDEFPSRPRMRGFCGKRKI